jgi:RHS repeat-associated protein
VRYYSHDQLGSTSALLAQAGTTQATYSYDAYGNPTNDPAEKQPFGYAGQYTDAETGLQYLRARYYDPATGQMLTRDPLVRATRQPYAYANNTPTNLTDPTGMSIFGDFLNAADNVGEAVGTAGAGVADGLSGGISTVLLNEVGVAPDTCSWFFRAGGAGGQVASMFSPGSRLLRFAARGLGAAGSAPTRITGYAVGRDGTRHGLHQAISRDGGRGVSPQAILNAVRNTKPEWQAASGTWKYAGDDAVVILNPRGEVVTTWARGSQGWRNLP